MFFLWCRISEVTKHCRLWNDLYCVEWGIKLYSNQPTTKRWLAAVAWWRQRRPLAVYCMHSGNITDIWSGSSNHFEYLYTFFASPIRSHWHDVIFKPKVRKVSGLGWIKLVFVEINSSLYSNAYRYSSKFIVYVKEQDIERLRSRNVDMSHWQMPWRTWNTLISLWNECCHWCDASHIVIGWISYGHTWTIDCVLFLTKPL